MRSLRNLWLVFALAATGAGCAVLTVDVDVYKGPLANHPETQVRQFAAYAIGVKHLLVSLRNTFEFGPEPQGRCREVRDALPFDFVKPNLLSGEQSACMAIDPQKPRYTFKDEQARLLNSVLSMYKDLGDEDTQPYLARLDEIWREFKRNAQAGSLDKSRKNLEDLWYLAIDAIWSVHSPAFYNDQDDDDKKYQVKVTGMLAPALANLTEPWNFSCALTVLASAGVLDSDAVTYLRDNDFGNALFGPGRWSQSRYAAATSLIKATILEHPVATVTLLKRAHEGFKGVEKKVIGEVCRGATSDVRVKLSIPDNAVGIVRVDVDGNFESTIEALQQQFEHIEQNVALGFEKGRLSRGIESLTKAYLEAVEQENTARSRTERTKYSFDTREAARKLEDHLIGFAEKILTVANHRALLEKSTGARSERQVLLLQAVGNTLLSFADELRYRADHVDRLKQRGDSERFAQERAFAVSSFQAFESLRQELRARAKQAAAEAEKLAAGAKKLEATSKQPVAQQSMSKKDELANTVKAERDEVGRLKGEVEPAAATVAVMGGKPLSEFEHLGEAQSLAKLAATLRKKVVTKGTPAPDEFVAAVRAAMEEEIRVYAVTESETGGWRKALAEAKKYLASKDIAPKQGGTPEQMYREVQKGAEAKVAAKRKEWTVWAVRLRESEKQLAALDKDDKSIKDQGDTLAARLKQARDDRTAFEAADKTITDLRELLFKSLDAAGADVGYDTMLRALVRLLGEKRDAATGAAQDEFKNALAALARFGGPPASAGGRIRTAGTRGEDQKTALDNVIDVLGNELIAATRDGNEARAENVRKAIAVANQRRADMAFVRPANAFLRNANAATSLQSDPNVFWQNMLGAHGWRSMSPFGLSEEEREINRTRTEIDKQFWQTVNTVRVAGAGKTDYVIAKDDIGNWYVKAYDADPSTIIKSAQGLALFNLGRNIDMNLLRQTEISRELKDPNLDSGRRTQLEGEQKNIREGSKSSVEPLSRVLDDYKKQYGTTLQNDAGQLGDYISVIGAELGKVWKGVVPTIADGDSKRLQDNAKGKAEVQFQRARSDLSSAELANPTAKTPVASRLLGAMNDLKRFAVTMEQDVANDAELVKSASDAADGANTALINARIALGTRSKAAKDIQDKIDFETTILERLSDPAAKDAQIGVIAKLRPSLEKAKSDEEEARKELSAKEKENTNAQTALTAARKDRETLAKAGRESIIARVRSLAERRLSEIARYEQAVIIVKGASSPPPSQ